MKKQFIEKVAQLIGKKYVKDHPDFVAAWWKAAIIGGMFRAGVRYGRKNP